MAKSRRPLTVKQIAKIAVPIFKRNDVLKAGVFGSAVRKELKKSSDIDFLIRMKRGKSLLDLVKLKYELEDSLGREVDLVEYSMIKPKIKDQILNEEVAIL
ncbi:MAG TPA: nucleotidyltransferase domain-containing protein [Candidatus Nanoarchaeia archaeon]|nr:nucleotidyltransferase domain-containing protein [Candidatus Nanoarchaeia archaeon]